MFLFSDSLFRLTGVAASDKPVLSNVVNNLKNFHASCKFKQGKKKKNQIKKISIQK